MPFPVAFFQKATQGVLLKAGNSGGLEREQPVISGKQGHRQYQIGDAEGRGQAAGKGAAVDHPVVKIAALQGGDGTAGIAVFAVVIVLDEIPPFLFRCPP